MRARPTKRMGKKIGIVAVSIVGACLVGAAIYAGSLVHKADTALNLISASGPSQRAPTDSKPITKDEALKPISFLIAGVDNREGGGGSMNTDVMMLVALNPEHRTATIVSLPRDMQLKPENISAQKANYYYAYYYNKDRANAITNTRTFFSELLHVPIDYMAVINFDGFRKLVDELGGLQIDVDMDMRYVDKEDGTNINLKKGMQTLKGKETLDFVRYRKSNEGTAESSDLARNGRQQQVLGQLLDKLTSFNGISQWGNVLDIAGQSVRTDVPESRIREWITQFRKLKPEHIEFVPLEGKWESPYIVPTETDLDAALTALRTRLELPDESIEESSSYPLSRVVRVESADSKTVTKDTYNKSR